MSVEHIWIVDRDATAALITQRGLQKLLGSAVRVTIAPSAGHAWQECKRGQVALVIVDPGPRDRAATALIKALREIHTGVVVLTAYDTPRLRRDMRNLNVHHYLAKPIDLSSLVETVRSIISVPLEIPKIGAPAEQVGNATKP